MARPKGKPNRTTVLLRTAAQLFVKQRFPEMGQVWAELSAKEKSRLFVALLSFAIPKPTPDFTDEERDTLIQRLHDKNYQHDAEEPADPTQGSSSY